MPPGCFWELIFYSMSVFCRAAAIRTRFIALTHIESWRRSPAPKNTPCHFYAMGCHPHTESKAPSSAGSVKQRLMQSQPIRSGLQSSAKTQIKTSCAFFQLTHFHLDESRVQSSYQANFCYVFGRFKCHTYDLDQNVYNTGYMHGE